MCQRFFDMRNKKERYLNRPDLRRQYNIVVA